MSAHQNEPRAIPAEAHALLYEGALGTQKAAMQAQLQARGTDYATIDGIIRSNLQLYKDDSALMQRQVNADIGELVDDKYLHARAQLFCLLEVSMENIFHMLEGVKIADNEWGKLMFEQQLRHARMNVSLIREKAISYAGILSEEGTMVTAQRIDGAIDEMKLHLGLGSQLGATR